ncbi:helix-turn-helix domain-containing protein [Nocardiopsis sp. LOL_012]|uniref:helix-turn-helix domain-containing protein n=1 Tax=Nocardiopsis sp. LOL_012 TaxID=3345409 RepID=UPI003A8387C4
MALSELVCAERDKRGWSLEEFAAQAGLSVDEVDDLEDSSAYPGPGVLMMLAAASDVVVHGTDDPRDPLAFVDRVA